MVVGMRDHGEIRIPSEVRRRDRLQILSRHNVAVEHEEMLCQRIQRTHQRARRTQRLTFGNHAYVQAEFGAVVDKRRDIVRAVAAEDGHVFDTRSPSQFQMMLQNWLAADRRENFLNRAGYCR